MVLNPFTPTLTTSLTHQTHTPIHMMRGTHPPVRVWPSTHPVSLQPYSQSNCQLVITDPHPPSGHLFVSGEQRQDERFGKHMAQEKRHGNIQCWAPIEISLELQQTRKKPFFFFLVYTSWLNITLYSYGFRESEDGREITHLKCQKRG